MEILVGLIAMHCYPQDIHGPKQPVTVYLHVKANVPIVTLQYAQYIASHAFANVGVQIHWRTDRPQTHTMGLAVIIEIFASTPGNFHPEALAFTREFEGVHIRVFYDRVESMVSAELIPALLGHVLAHELTHSLERVDRHSHDGMMKAHWTMDDLHQMSKHLLPFDPHDVELIRNGLATRASALREAAAESSRTE